MFLILPLILIPFIFPELVSAHAFGTLYNLPVPFWLYLYGAGATLIVSFLIIGYFVNKTSGSNSYSTKEIKLFNFLLNNSLIDLFKFISIFLFLITTISGLIGTKNSLQNFNMTFFWIIFLLGLTYLSAITGDIYSVLNPWKIIIGFLEKFIGKVNGLIKYPKYLGYYPAVIFYFYLIWVELFGAVTPFRLSILIVQYTIVNFLGVFLVGKDSWFKYGEFFSVFFRLLGKITPFATVDKKVYLKQPFIGLAQGSAEDFSLTLFVIFMLASTAYDGFHSTTTWIKFSLLVGDQYFLALQKIGFFIAPAAFLLVYFILVFLMKVIVRSQLSFKELSLKFTLTLVPIALVYNFAHYYTLLVTQGQEIIKLISDPFGFGWNLFGTSGYIANIGILNAGFVWHSQVAGILLGHIAAVYLAHLVSLQIFKNHKKALISQIPMLLLMVIYTMAGLWILSQPIGGA